MAMKKLLLLAGDSEIGELIAIYRQLGKNVLSNRRTRAEPWVRERSGRRFTIDRGFVEVLN